MNFDLRTLLIMMIIAFCCGFYAALHLGEFINLLGQGREWAIGVLHRQPVCDEKVFYCVRK